MAFKTISGGIKSLRLWGCYEAVWLICREVFGVIWAREVYFRKVDSRCGI